MITLAIRPRLLHLASCCTALFACSNSPIRAQNLVPNGGFEDIISCPTNGSQLDHTEFWTTPDAGTPDYYHACAIAVVGVPVNLNGSQAAHTGVAYSGIWLWAPGGYGGEYVEVQLTDPLQSGICYHFAMHVSLADNCQVTTDAIGVAFSDTAIANLPGGVPLPLAQQVSNPSGVFLPDTGWLEVSGDFIAAGGEEYLIIGNFNDYVDTDTVSTTGGSYLFAYTYLDDVSVVQCAQDAVFGIGSVHDFIGPNPFTDQLSVGSGLMGNCPLRVVDARGALVHETWINGRTVLSTTNWATGLYVIDLTLPDGTRARGKFLK